MDGCQLPDEILAKIFTYCPVGTLYNVMLACRRFRNCVNINSVWKSKLLELLGPLLLTEHLEVMDFTMHSDEIENCKEIYQRFCLVFNQKFKYDDDLFKCPKCSSVFCTTCCLHDRDEMITFDFGSKTTWLKYAGEITGQLSMHPTVGPMKTHAEDFWTAFSSSSFANSTALAYECCPVCAGIILRRSANSAMLDAELDKKMGQVTFHPGRFTKALSKLSSFKGLQCFSFSESVDDDSVLLPDVGKKCASAAEPLRNASSPTVAVDNENDAFETYKFLLQHLLSRYAFYHLHNVPFVICEPVGCDDRLKVELTNAILCHFKAPGSEKLYIYSNVSMLEKTVAEVGKIKTGFDIALEQAGIAA